MTKDPSLETRIEKAANGAEKPDLAIAMELVQYMTEKLVAIERSLTEQVRAATQANAQTVKRIDEMEGSFQLLKQDLEKRAAERADKDVREAAARYQIALEQKDKLSTQERIEVGKVVADQLTAAKQARALYWRGVVDKVTPNIVTAMIAAVVIPVWLAITIGILAFILRALGIPVPFPAP